MPSMDRIMKREKFFEKAMLQPQDAGFAKEEEKKKKGEMSDAEIAAY